MNIYTLNRLALIDLKNTEISDTVIKIAGHLVAAGVLTADNEISNTASRRSASLAVTVKQPNAVIRYPT